jgi:hypothetical protein
MKENIFSGEKMKKSWKENQNNEWSDRIIRCWRVFHLKDEKVREENPREIAVKSM